MSFSNRNAGGGSTTPTMLSSSLHLDETESTAASSSGANESIFHPPDADAAATATAEEVDNGLNADLMSRYSMSERLSACQTALRTKERMLRRLRAEQEDQLGLLCR